jgi:sugar transferase (PEP-CTERM system associated)
MTRLHSVYFPTKSVFLFLSEALIVSGSLAAALWVLRGSDAYILLNYEYGWPKIFGLTFLVAVMSYYFDLYEPTLLFDRGEIYFRTLLVLGCVCILVSILLYFYPNLEISHNAFAFSFVLMSILLLAWRKLFPWILNKSVFRERVYSLGQGDYAESIAQIVRHRRDLGMDVVGCQYSLADGTRAENATQAVQSMLRMKTPVHRVIIAMQDHRDQLPTEDLLVLRFQGVVLEESGALLERLYGKIPLSGLRPSDFLYVEGFRVRPSQQFTRRVVSTIAAAVGLLLFAPFFPIVMLMVRLSSPGPIFFRQVRVGENGKNFNVYKFRTMRSDAEANGAQWASKNDPRITIIGRFMRKTRIDEIPQLWNVLRGDMGFVGPRPERPEFVPWLAEQLPFYNLRHMIRPGLTGWAQVRYGYGATLEEAQEKLEYDLYYLKHASVGLDLLIMFETIKIILHRRGAQ